MLLYQHKEWETPDKEENKMKKEFLEKVKHEGIVDTRKYRYVYSNGEIKRLPIEYLDTTAALSEWEVVLSFVK